MILGIRVQVEGGGHVVIVPAHVVYVREAEVDGQPRAVLHLTGGVELVLAHRPSGDQPQSIAWLGAINAAIEQIASRLERRVALHGR